MKTNRIAFAVVSLVVLVTFAAALLKIQLAHAQTESTSTEPTTEEPALSPGTTTHFEEQAAASSTETSPAPDEPAASSTSTETSTPEVDGADASPTAPDNTSPSASETAPPTSAVSSQLSLTQVHLAGTRYIDYCTDGTTITAYPGDPAVAANFDKPDAPTPQCPEGQTWHHTSGMTAYDTPSGDLEVGQYATREDGTHIVHYPAMRYASATSTLDWPPRITIVSGDPAAVTYSGDVAVITQ